MAIVVCQKHSWEGVGVPLPQQPEFVSAMDAFGYPDTAAICFVPGCEEPGWVFFRQAEEDAFMQGQRIFTATFPEQFMKVRCVGPGDPQPIARKLKR